MKLIEYLQQPSSIYALMALLISTRSDGLLRTKDMIEWFLAEGTIVNVDELKQRWTELEQMGLAKKAVGGWRQKWKVRAGTRIGYVLTEKGDKAAEALTEAVNYIKTL